MWKDRNFGELEKVTMHMEALQTMITKHVLEHDRWQAYLDSANSENIKEVKAKVIAIVDRSISRTVDMINRTKIINEELFNEIPDGSDNPIIKGDLIRLLNRHLRSLKRYLRELELVKLKK